MMFNYFKLKKGKQMKKLLAILVLAVSVTGCVFVAKKQIKSVTKLEKNASQ